MLLKLFKGYQAFLLILIPLLGVALWFNSFMQNEVEINGDYVTMPLSQLVFNLVGRVSFLSRLLALLLLIMNAFLLVRLNISYNFIRTRTYLPAVFYIFLLSYLSEIQRLTPALMGSTFIILAINKVLSTFKQERLVIQIMDASLLVSVASLFYFPAIFFLIYLWIGLILFRPFNWREWVFTLLGLATPYLIYAGINYIAGKDLTIPLKNLLNIPYINYYSKENIKLIDILFLCLNALLLIFASFQMLRLFGTKKVHSRRIFIYFLWLFIFTILLYLIIPSTSLEILYINALSLSFLLAHFFINLKGGWFSELLFMLILGFIIANKLMSF